MHIMQMHLNFKGGEIMLKFDKDAVLQAIKDAGNEDCITQEIIDDLNNYDDCDAVKSDWDALVNDKELYVVTGKNGNKCKVERQFLKEVI